MAEKKISRRQVSFIPARLSQKADRWEIVFYQTDPATGARRRHRETWDLNRIQDQRQRLKEARAIISQINSWLPEGYPHTSPGAIQQKADAPGLAAAVALAIADKTKSDKFETQKSYGSVGGVLLRWIEKRRLEKIYPGDFTRRLALEFLDHAGERTTRDGKPIGARTWNNYCRFCHAIFAVLVAREYVTTNPFSGIALKPVAEKSRRKFSQDERAAVAAWLHEKDFICFLAALMHYHGLFRGTEMRRLRKSDFFLDKGLIYLKGEKSKTGRERWVTMTVELREVLNDPRFQRIPDHFFVFGERGKPHASRPMGRGHLWRRMREALEELHRTGVLEDISGLSPYGLKDTGITDWLKNIPLPDVMRQAGHTNPGTTMIYYQPDRLNEPFALSEASILTKGVGSAAGIAENGE